MRLSPKLFISTLGLCFSCYLSALPLEPTPAPQGARVFFVAPSSGETVQAPFMVRFGKENLKLTPAGEEVEGGGHFHLSIDGKASIRANEPMGSEVIHLDNGESELNLFLTPGTHNLQIIFGDYLHRPHNPPIVSERITIEVSSE